MTEFDYRDGILHAEDVAIPALADAVGTPFYCYSSAGLTRRYTAFAEAFAGQDALICYSVKANSNLAVIRTLAGLGAGADVVSEGELRRALAAGVPPERIVFSGVGKTRGEIAYALAQGIYRVNVESEPELRVLGAVAAAAGKDVEIGIRVNPDVDAKTHAKIATGRAENKFGVEIAKALDIFAAARALPGVTPRTVAVHIGSQLNDLAPMRAAFSAVAKLVVALRADGHAIDGIDFGGGLGIRYDDEDPPSRAQYAAMVLETTGNLGCRLIFEPGRNLTGNSGILVTRVIYEKHSTSRRFVIVDAAMNDFIRPAMYEAYHDIQPVRESGAARSPADIVGPVCETGDIFARARLLPALSSDDMLAFASAGAYGAVMASTYNTRRLIPEVLVRGDAYSVVRRRPDYDELLNLERLADWQ